MVNEGAELAFELHMHVDVGANITKLVALTLDEMRYQASLDFKQRAAATDVACVMMRTK